MSNTNNAPHSTTGTSEAGMPVIDPKRKSCRLPAYPGARAMIATPRAKAPTKSTPMTESSLSLRFCASSATSTAVTTPASAPPSTRDPPHTNAIARPGNTECATASPMKAMPRRTTCTPTLPHTRAATTAMRRARGRNASAGFIRSRKKSRGLRKSVAGARARPRPTAWMTGFMRALLGRRGSGCRVARRRRGSTGRRRPDPRACPRRRWCGAAGTGGRSRRARRSGRGWS